jgi:DNA repair exonuclease SbcCD nuclease subunit
MSTDILHTADTHLGYRQYHKPEREEDFRQAFEKVVTEAIDRDVDVVVHSGDLFNRSRPSINSLSELVEQLNRLRDAGIEFCTIVGNHDSTRDREWPSFLEDIGLAVYLGYDGYVVNDVTLYGQDYVDPGQRSRLDYQFKPAETDTAFLVGHGLFTPFPHGDWDMGEILAKSTVEFDALLLGDDHKPQIDSIDNIPITYPGSTERTAADQRDKRGYNIVTVNGDVSISHETIDTRQFRYVDIEMEPDHGTEEVLTRLENETIPSDSILIVTLTGDGNRVTPADIERVGERDGALVVRVNDRREFSEIDTELRDVTIEDPEDAVKDRKPELGLSTVADGLENLARDIDGVPKSNLKSLSEEQVEEMLDERDPEEFVANDPSEATLPTDSPNESTGENEDTDSDAVPDSRDQSDVDRDTSPDDVPGDAGENPAQTEEQSDEPATPSEDTDGSGQDQDVNNSGGASSNNSETDPTPPGTDGEDPDGGSNQSSESTDSDGQMRLSDL